MSFFKCFLLLLFVQAVTPIATAQVVLNEYAPSNRDILQDSEGSTPDWVELYNSGATTENLEGYALSDDTLEPAKWKFPSISLPPGGFLIVFCSGRNQIAGELHTSFSIGAGREPVLLFKNGQLLDGLYTACVPTGETYGRKPDGAAATALLKTPSPEASNNQSPAYQLNLPAASLTVSHVPGFYKDSFLLELKSSHQIRYSLDGSEPDDRSPVYTSPLLIRDRSNEPNDFSDKKTSPEAVDPDGPVRKSTALRAVAWDQGCPVSDLFTGTYFVGLNYTFPVVSVVTDEDEFFDKDEGIYVPGRSDVVEEANYNQKGSAWERPAHFEYFVDEQQVLSQQVGVRIHGRDSRNRPQKSLRIYAKESYGNDSLKYPFFEDKPMQAYRRILIRTTWNHPTNPLFKDELTAYLLKDLNLGVMAHQPAILFINGEYWGIHNLRERQDKYYISGNYGADPEQIDFLGLSLEGEEENEGTDVAWNALMDYVNTHDLSVKANYDYVAERVDIENYINYQIAYLYFANFDWPRNNVRFWRVRADTAKWRWMFFDCDVCFYRTDYDFISNYEHGSEKFGPYTELMMALMENKDFSERFVSTFFSYLGDIFSPSHVLPLIESFRQRYAPEVPEHIHRWGFPDSYYTWNFNADQMAAFAMRRPLVMMERLQGLFGSPFKIYPNPASGSVQLSLGPAGGGSFTYAVYDLAGKLCQGYNTGTASPVDISALSPGIYLVVAEYNGLRFTEKLVVGE